jgi:hypothetical protein
MSADERMIAKSQQSEDQDDERESRYWLYFQQAIDIFDSLTQYKFVITPKVKANYIWYKYQNQPANGFKSTSTKTKYLVQCDVNDLSEICDKLEGVVSDFKLFQFMLPVIAPGCYDNRSKIAKGIATYLSLQKAETHSVSTLHSISIGDDKPAEIASFIPELNQFPKALLDLGLKREDFLQWLFAKPEIDMFSLHVGRAGCLPQGAKYSGQDEAVFHSYRNVLILKSTPFLGKSWVNNWLISGFESCGLFTAVIQDLSRQFGHGQWVSSAWSYLDDSTEAMIAAFFNSPILKTVASNGLVNVESKGVDHATIKAFTTPILLANDIDSRHLASCDSGNANRIKIVACKDIHSCNILAANLKKDSPIYGVKSVIPAAVVTHLCKKAGVSQETLAAYFIRLCVDYFNSFTMDTLTAEIAKISQELYASYMTNGINVLAKAAVLAYLLRNNVTVSQIDLLKIRFSEAGNSAPFILESLICLADLDSRITPESQGLIKNLIKQHWIKAGKDVGHPWQTHRNYSTYFLTKLGTIAEVQMELLARKGRDTVSLDKVYQAVFSELRDTDGNPSVYSISRIQDAWKSALILNFDYIRNIYQFILNELRERDNVAELAIYRQRQMDFGLLFTKLATPGANPLVNIPDDYYSGYQKRDLAAEVLWDGN